MVPFCYQCKENAEHNWTRANTTQHSTAQKGSITRWGGNFAYVESLFRGTTFLVVFVQLALVHSKFDKELCWEINRRCCCFSWKPHITATPLYLVMVSFLNHIVATLNCSYPLDKLLKQNKMKQCRSKIFCAIWKVTLCYQLCEGS